MRAFLIAASFWGLVGGAAPEVLPFHDEIPEIFRGNWASSLADCRDPDGVNKIFIDGKSVNYYEANDYVLIGIEFSGAMTKRGGSGALYNGRFTSRSESRLLGENNIRMEIDDRNRNVLYRYPLDDDGEPIAAREVTNVRCVGK